MSSKAKKVLRKNMRDQREESPFVRRDVEKFRTLQRKLARDMKRQTVSGNA